jgi:hypothetical protein
MAIGSFAFNAQQIPRLHHDVRRVANRKNLRVPRHGKV